MEDGIVWNQQPNLINNLNTKFGKKAIDIRSNETLGRIWFNIVRLNGEVKIPIASQSQYRSGIEMFLYPITTQDSIWRMWLMNFPSI
jgi:hypothetical protein